MPHLQDVNELNSYLIEIIGKIFDVPDMSLINVKIICVENYEKKHVTVSCLESWC